MPQNIYTVAELRQAIADLLAEELGKYSNGQPAIWVEPPASPKGIVEGGLEVSILKMENILSSVLLLNNQQEERYEWIVTIKTTERLSLDEYSKFSSAVNKMRRFFPRRREIIAPFTEDQDLTATFRLSELRVVNSYL